MEFNALWVVLAFAILFLIVALVDYYQRRHNQK